MATITAITTGLQTVTATGPVTPTAGIDISAVTGDFTVCVEVIAMTAGKTARIQFEDTTNAFTAATALEVVHVQGQMGQGGTSFTSNTYNPTTEKQTYRKYFVRNNVFGVASAKLRANITAIDSSASLTFNAWIET